MSAGAGRIYRRGGVWWLDYAAGGKRHRESSGSDKKGEARALLKKRIGEVERGILTGKRADKVTMGEMRDALLADYETKRCRSLGRMKGAVAHLIEYFGEDARALAITPDRVRAYIAARRDEKAADGTIGQELAHLKRMFRIAAQDGKLPTVPFIPSLSVNNTREGFVTLGDLGAILKELPEHLRAPTEFAFVLGWRKGEVLGLRWSAVDLGEKVVRLAPGTTKNDEGREVDFGALPQVVDLLTRQRELTRAIERERGTIIPHVFHRDGQPILSMDGAWRAACKRAGFEGILFHDLRRSAVRNLEAAGVSRSVAMSFTGHKTESIYKRYAIVDRGAQREAGAKVAKLYDEASRDRTVVPLRKEASAR